MPSKRYDAYPLTWPLGWKRAERRRTARYRISFGDARDQLVNSLRLMNARDVVISSNVPPRRDGLPLATFAQPNDPGVAVYWTEVRVSGSVQRVIACDAWAAVTDNLRAIGLSVDALRQLQRTGTSEILERAFTGFAALPADSSIPDPASHWRAVLGVDNVRYPPEVMRRIVDQAYRRALFHAHPDHGGSTDALQRVTAARAAANAELKE